MMQANSFFISNIQAIYGEAGKKWLNNLPSQVEHLSKLWDFRFISALPNLSYSFVGLVELHSNQQKAILKIAPKDVGLINEATWLKSFTKCVPQVYHIDETEN